MKEVDSSRDDSSILHTIDELYQDFDPPPDDLTDNVLFAFDLDLAYSSGLTASPDWGRHEEL